MMGFRELPGFKRFVAPAVSICGCVFMVLAACFAHGTDVIAFLIVSAAVIVVGMFFIRGKELNE